MIAALISKFLLIGLFMSILNILRHTYNLIQAYVANEEGNNTKYILQPMGLLFLGLSISYILMSIVSGAVLT